MRATVDGGELLKRIERLIAYFERTDQEWVVHHICTLYNHMRLRLPLCSAAERRFIHELPESIRRMADHDPSRRLDEPKQCMKRLNAFGAIAYTAAQVDDFAVRFAIR